jgi:hypothetical protein
MATLEGSVGAANQQLEKTSKLVKRIDDLGQRVTRGFEKWSGVLKSAKGVMGEIQSIWGTLQNVTAAVDNYTLLNMKLERINDSYATMAELQTRLTEGANDARVDYEVLAETVLGLEDSDNEMIAGKQVSDNIAFVEAYAQALKGLGFNTAREAEELAKMVEIMGSVDTELSGDQLQDLIGNSKVLNEIFGDMASNSMEKSDFFNAIMEHLDMIEERAEAVQKTFGEVWNNFANTAMLALMPAIDKFAELTATGAFQDFMNTLIEGIPKIGEVFFNIVSFMVDNSSKLLMWIMILIGAFIGFKFTLLLLQMQTMFATNAQKLFNKAVAANGIFMLIMMVSMAVMAIMWLWENVEGFRKAIQTLVNVFIAGINGIIKGLNFLFQTNIPTLDYVDFVHKNEEDKVPPDNFLSAVFLDEDLSKIRGVPAEDIANDWKDTFNADPAYKQNWASNEEAMNKYFAAGGISGLDLSDAALKDMGDSIKLDTVNNVSVETPPSNITINFTGDISNKMDLSNMIKYLAKELQKTVNSSSNVVVKAG